MLFQIILVFFLFITDLKENLQRNEIYVVSYSKKLMLKCEI